MGTLETKRGPVLRGVREGFATATAALLAGTIAFHPEPNSEGRRVMVEEQLYAFPSTASDLEASPAMRLAEALLT